jgi:hypothetical protein
MEPITTGFVEVPLAATTVREERGSAAVFWVAADGRDAVVLVEDGSLNGVNQGSSVLASAPILKDVLGSAVSGWPVRLVRVGRFRCLLASWLGAVFASNEGRSCLDGLLVQ